MIRFIRVIVLFPVFFSLYARAQQLTGFADIKLYDAVLDRLFAQSDDHDHTVGCVETLQYMPSYSTEMGIVVSESRSNKSEYRVDVWLVPPGEPTLWKQLAALVSKNPNLTADQAAAALVVKHLTKRIRGASTLGQLIESGHAISIPVHGEDTITLDGDSYKVIIRSIAISMSLTFNGPVDSASDRSPLIRWMGRIRSEVEREVANNEKAWQ